MVVVVVIMVVVVVMVMVVVVIVIVRVVDDHDAGAAVPALVFVAVATLAEATADEQDVSEDGSDANCAGHGRDLTTCAAGSRAASHCATSAIVEANGVPVLSNAHPYVDLASDRERAYLDSRSIPRRD
jgi:hypothetical protein